MPKKHWHPFFFFAFIELKFYFFLTYGNAGRLIPILFWVWIRLQNIFLGVPKSCGTHLKWVAGQDFFVQFWIMSFQQYFSHFFFFSSFVGQVVALTSSELLGKIFFPSFVGQVVASTSNELLAKIFFTSFVGQVVALTSSELLAKIFLFSFESCPFNNISVIRIF